MSQRPFTPKNWNSPRNNTPSLIAPPEPNERTVRVMIDLPESLYEHYKQQGEAWGRTAEHEISTRLQRCRSHVSTTPLYFTDDQRAELQRALGHLCTEPDVVLAQLKNAVQLQVGEVKVVLSPKLQQRIKSRVFRGETYEGVVQRETVKALEIFTGIRPA